MLGSDEQWAERLGYKHYDDMCKSQSESGRLAHEDADGKGLAWAA
jgi:hypothetical protein